MNKKEFINELQKKLNCDEQKAILINEILESNFIIGKKNKEQIVKEIEQLSFSNEEAEKVYEIAMTILSKSLKDKIKHPFTF